MQKQKKPQGFAPPQFLADGKFTSNMQKCKGLAAYKTRSKKTGAGFTLLELLVVMAIIGVLAGFIGLAVNTARVKGRDAKRIGDARQLANAMEQYFTQHGSYPTGTLSAQNGGGVLSTPNSFNSAAEPVIPNYIPLIPQSPTPADGSCSGDPGKGNNNYWYETSMDGSTYTLTLCLGKGNNGWYAGTRTLTPNGMQ